mmetsp:Transcript_6486/g.10910  ORF Transcript_6486/g.10910 Transcript_6486/m.10910 type:complete len:211 (-) Transcript_6486:237-869(-)
MSTKNDLFGDSSSEADTDDLIAAAKSQPIATKKKSSPKKKAQQPQPDADNDTDDDDDDDEWDDTATFSTYPPTSIMLVPNNHLDAIATPHRSRMYRGYSDSSSTCSSHGHNSSLPPLPLLTLPKLEEPELWAQDEYGPLYKPDVDDETDEDEDQIPHVMSCPDILGDSEDEDDISDLPYAESHSLYVHSIESASCPGRLITEGSIASIVL